MVATTYDNISDGWRLLIDQQWHERITAVKTTENSLSEVEFYEYISPSSRIHLFSIYAATGATREYYAGRTDLIQLGESSQAVYFAKIADEAQNSALALGAEGIQSRFSLVTQDWNY